MARTVGFHTVIEGKNNILANSPYEAYLLMKAKNARKHIFHMGQTSTATYAEWASDGGETIADIGKTEETWIFCSTADDTTLDGDMIYLTYLDNSGEVHKTSGAFAAPDTSAETAFSPAVADGYAVISATLSGAATTETVCIGPTGLVADATKRRCTIANTATAAVEAAAVNTGINGVGTVYGREDDDEAGAAGEVVYFEYWTPWYERKTAQFTVNATESTEVKCYITDTYGGTATSVTVKDFYRMIRMYSADAADDEWWICNVGGTAIYAIMAVDDYTRLDSKYNTPASTNRVASGVGTADGDIMAKDGSSSYLTNFKVNTGDHTNLASAQITFYQNGEAHTSIYTREDIGTVDPNRWDVLPIRLEPEKDIVFKIKKNADANHSTYFMWYEILEVW